MHTDQWRIGVVVAETQGDMLLPIRKPVEAMDCAGCLATVCQADRESGNGTDMRLQGRGQGLQGGGGHRSSSLMLLLKALSAIGDSPMLARGRAGRRYMH